MAHKKGSLFLASWLKDRRMNAAEWGRLVGLERSTVTRRIAGERALSDEVGILMSALELCVSEMAKSGVELVDMEKTTVRRAMIAGKRAYERRISKARASELIAEIISMAQASTQNSA